MSRINRAHRKRRSHPGMFWLGAGLGLVVSAAVVVIAAEFTYVRRRRLLKTGDLGAEDALVQDLSEAVHEGLNMLTHAAHELGQTFASARRELVRFGLEPQQGAGEAGYYYEDEEVEPLREVEPSQPDAQWSNEESA